jgi:hypothetical protein
MPITLATQEAEISRIIGRGLASQANSSQDPISKNPWKKSAGGVAQGVGPKFKPQYCQKEEKIQLEKHLKSRSTKKKIKSQWHSTLKTYLKNTEPITVRNGKQVLPWANLSSRFPCSGGIAYLKC